MFAQRLQELRKELKKTQKDLASYLGITRQGYGNYESGQTEPDQKTLLLLSDYFDVSIDYLVGKSEVRNPEKQNSKGFSFLGGPDEYTKEEIEYAKATIETLRRMRRENK
jgi:transcriptional regulator with XRE-family HTH domain